MESGLSRDNTTRQSHLNSESVNSKRRSQLIDKELLQAKRELEKHKEDPRVLILGSGDSGKTTLLKQLKIKFSGFSDDDRGFYKKHIRANLWNNFLLIVGKAQEMHLEISNPDVRAILDEVSKNYECSNEAPGTQEAPELTAEITTMIVSVLSDPQIQKFYETIQSSIQDTAPYFFKDAKKYLRPDFIPSNDDILQTRVSTLQATDNVVSADNKTFHFIDVGGQHHFRKQWSAFFDNVNAIVFVVSLSSYNQNLEENTNKNRMTDAMELFETICNDPILSRIPITLLLNKADLFEKKVAQFPISDYFPDFTPSSSNPFKAGAKYFEQKLLQCNNSSKRRVTAFLTKCTDTSSMDAIINQLLHEITNGILFDSQ